MTAPEEQSTDTRTNETDDASRGDSDSGQTRPIEYGGRKNSLDPVRYGDWEKNGRCIDF